MDKEAKPFGTYDIVKYRVEIDLKTTSAMKKKEKMVKKMKERLGVEDDEEDDDEEKAKGQGPLAITQGLGEDKDEEGAKKEKIEEVE